MCRFTVSQSPVSSHEDKFSRTEFLLGRLCEQMELVQLRISDVRVRLERAEPQSPASVSLELQLQVLQGVYSQMYEVAGLKAEELEDLHISL